MIEAMAKYSQEAQKKVEEKVTEMKAGKLKSGTGKKVTSMRQAIAIALSEAREEGARVPPPPGDTSNNKRTKE